jgi:hypothetical protein
MAVTVEASGTQAATVGTEHSLFIGSTPKTYVGVVDLVNLAAGDEVELRVKLMVLSGGTRRQSEYAVFANAQDDLIVSTPPLASPYEWEITLKQTAGTARSFPWHVVSV